MAAAHYQLDNFTAFLDHNGLQIDGRNEDVMNVMPVAEKFESFGWNIIKIDGHDMNQIVNAVEEAKGCKKKPTFVIAETHKGQGVSFMLDQVGWHGKAPNDDQCKQAITELGGEI